MTVSLLRLLSVADVRRRARRQLPRAVFEFIDGGAEDGLTLHDNRAAFERQRIVPRVLANVSAPALRTVLFEQPVAAPLVIAPMGSCMLAWPQADIAIARAAADQGLPYTLSTLATTGLERLAAAVDGPLWFQLYVLKDRELNLRLLRRAQDCGYQALVVTVDLPAGGKREQDLRNGISLPLRPGLRQAWQALTHPGWTWRMARGGLPRFENVEGSLGDERAGLTIAARVGQNLDASFDWDALARLREAWRGPLIVKGVLHPADAERLVHEGVDGLWVSNHGGRQLDGALASADALPAVARAVAGRVPLLLDSGVRRGVDILKARALGASAVAIGRAALFGAAVAGQAGVARVLQILLDELRLAMQLAGQPDIDAVGPELLASPGDFQRSRPTSR